MAAALVQSNKGSTVNSPTAGKITATFTGAVASASLVCGHCGSDVNTAPTVTDDKGNSYSIADSIHDNTNGEHTYSFYKENITNAPTIITADWGGGSSVSNGFVIIHEVSGILTTSPLDQHTGQNQAAPGTGAGAVRSTSVTTTTDGQYIYGGAMDTGDFRAANQYTAFTGFTERQETGTASNIDGCSIDAVQSVAGAIEARFTGANADASNCLIMTFKATGGTGTTLTPGLGAELLSGKTLLLGFTINMPDQP